MTIRRHTLGGSFRRAEARFGGCARTAPLRAGVLACALALVAGGCRPPRAAPSDARIRLVSTAPNLTEIVFAIGAGDLLVGRTESCDYPPECVRIPTVGGFGTPNLEPLLAVKPTRVLETVLADPDITRRLETFHIPVAHIACGRLDDIPDAIRSVGALSGREARARLLAEDIRRGLADARAALPAVGDRPRVALLVSSDPPITAGRRAFVSELVTLAGCVNIGDASDVDYYHVSSEWMLAQSPDILLCLFATGGRDPQPLFASQTGWGKLAAVRNRRVYTVPDLNVVCRPGPRVLNGLADIRRILALDARRTNTP